MTTDTQHSGGFELCLEGTGQAWPAEIEAQGTDHLRVRLGSIDGELPRFQNGTALRCFMDGSLGRCSAGARVLSQNGPTLWLNVEPQWRRGGRRQHPRITAGFPVSYEVGGITGIGLCVNVSAGGMRIRVGEELPADEPVAVIFRLPDQGRSLKVIGQLLYQREVGEFSTKLEAGLKFVAIPISQAARLASFCRNAQ